MKAYHDFVKGSEQFKFMNAELFEDLDILCKDIEFWKNELFRHTDKSTLDISRRNVASLQSALEDLFASNKVRLASNGRSELIQRIKIALEK
ncbi:hypothetical protein ACSU64_20450 [Bacillaceae bacterium C204]|uniref:hypothetical protein n=1 Tax=Neobacillus sp. 204 TaxID=3383351 RepID=UPI00397932CD